MAQALIAPPSQDFLQKTLGSSLSAGATTATLSNTTGIQNLYGVFVVDRVDSNGTETPTKREVIRFAGTSGSDCTSLTRGLDGTSDQDHAVGAIVEFVPTAKWAQSIYDGLSETIVASTGALDTTKVVTPTGTQTLTNKTLTAPIISTISNTGTLTLPTSTDTLVGKATTDTLTNKTLAKPTINGSVQGVTADSDGATITFDLASSNVHTVTLGGNRTLAISNETSGQFFVIKLTQDGTGSRTVTWFSTIKWAGGSAPTLTTTAAKADTFGFMCTGTDTYDGFIIGQNI